MESLTAANFFNMMSEACFFLSCRVDGEDSKALFEMSDKLDNCEDVLANY